MSSFQEKGTGKYSADKQKYSASRKTNVPAHSKENLFPIDFSGKAKLADIRQRYSGYTIDELRNMVVRLGFKHPEVLMTRLDLMQALDDMTSEI